MSCVTIPGLHMEESEVFITFQSVENEPDTSMAKREPSKLELDISKYISSNQLHHSEDPGLVGEGAPVRPRVAGGGGGRDREGQEVPGHHEDSFIDESSEF